MRQFALLLLLLSTHAWAGTVETNVRVCGISAPYLRYGEPAHGLFGNSSTGVLEQAFRVKGHLNIEENTDAPKGAKADAIADFVSALEVRGMHLCIRGNLERIERGGKTLYDITPKSFQITESPASYLAPSQLAGSFSPGFTVLAIDDTDFGRKFFIAELPALISRELGGCSDTNLAFAPVRKDKNILVVDMALPCGVVIHSELRRNEDGSITGTVKGERPSLSKSFSFEIRR